MVARRVRRSAGWVIGDRIGFQAHGEMIDRSPPAIRAAARPATVTGSRIPNGLRGRVTTRQPSGILSPNTRQAPRPVRSTSRLVCDFWVTYAGGVTDDDLVFKALADPTRRFLLDRLFERDGRTLSELESQLPMSRFGVMKHLRLLEDAGLVVTRKSGREKLHFLNPVPIRLIHDRWIDKYTARQVSALADLKAELENEP